MKKRIGKKGAAPVIAIAIVFMVAVVVIEGVIFNNFIADVEVVKRTARELAVINAVDAVEFAKKALKQAVSYSFYKSSKDVLARGGFCAYDESPCDESCKIPEDIETFDCTPWWRIYTSTYEPSLSDFTSYLSMRTSAIYDDYSSSFYGPSYCPEPPGDVTVEDTGEYSVYVSATNAEGGVIEYTGENLDIVEHTVIFEDTFEITTFEVFALAKAKFVDEDSVRSAFNAADDNMENECSEMETRCQNGEKGIPINADCLDADPNGIECQYLNKDTCKLMEFGDVCEDDMPGKGDTPTCEDYLKLYCCQEDNWNDCDFDEDGKVDAIERYKCKVLEQIRNLGNRDPEIEDVIDPFSYLALTADKATGDAECLKAESISHLLPEKEDQVRISCNWEDDADNTAPYDTQCCIRVKDEKCCGCKDRCVDDEDCNKDPECTSEGRCPSDDAYACPSDGCGYWTCSDSCVERECTAPCTIEECDSYTVCEPCTIDGELQEGCPPCEEEEHEDCEDVEYDECGRGKCPWGDCIEWRCTFSWVSKAQVCGYKDCEETRAVVEDVRCVFDYVGTANVEVNVFDEEKRYPISGWEQLNLPFYVVSGNVEGCDGKTETDICCAAVTTEDTECKTS